MAIRTLHQMANENMQLYPKTFKKILQDFYVVDIMTGADDEQAALKYQQELINILKFGGFVLKKWA